MGKIFYEKATGNIVSGRLTPSGSAPEPTLDNCYPGMPYLHDRYGECENPWGYLTKEAQQNLRIIDGKVYLKPHVILSCDKSQVTADNTETFTIAVDILDTHLVDSISEVQVLINDTLDTIAITDESGSETYTTDIVGAIEITVQGDYRTMPLIIKGVSP